MRLVTGEYIVFILCKKIYNLQFILVVPVQQILKYKHEHLFYVIILLYLK